MKRIALTLVLGLVGSMGIANAIVAFTTFAPVDVYNTSTGYVIAGPTTAAPQRIAMQFTSGASGILDTIRFANFYSAGDAGLNLVLYNDDGADQIGTGMVAWGFTDSNTSGHITTMVNPFPSVVLTSGQKYWVELLALTNGNHAWNLTDPSIPNGRVAASTNNGSTYSYFSSIQMSAFDVNVVPEPASMIALGLGASALLARRRKKA